MPVTVCVPARNEEQALPVLLEALSTLAVAAERLTVCIYLDGCDDGSRAILDRAAATFPCPLIVAAERTCGDANAGAARRAAMAMGLAVLADGEGLLFTTDADSRPRPDWVEAGTIALQAADAVAGRIIRLDGAADPGQSRIERYYDRLHRYRRLIDPVPWEARVTHHFTGGANMAIRASVYRALGGFAALHSGEDAALLDDAARAGFRVRRDGAMVVDTSSRRTGRAAHGLASALLALDAGRLPTVAHPHAATWQWQNHAAARGAFTAIHQLDVRADLGERLGLTADHVLGVARDCPNAEAFAMRIVPASPIAAGTVSLAVAEEALAVLEAGWREVAA